MKASKRESQNKANPCWFWKCKLIVINSAFPLRNVNQTTGSTKGPNKSSQLRPYTLKDVSKKLVQYIWGTAYRFQASNQVWKIEGYYLNWVIFFKYWIDLFHFQMPPLLCVKLAPWETLNIYCWRDLSYGRMHIICTHNIIFHMSFLCGILCCTRAVIPEGCWSCDINTWKLSPMITWMHT